MWNRLIHRFKPLFYEPIPAQYKEAFFSQRYQTNIRRISIIVLLGLFLQMIIFVAHLFQPVLDGMRIQLLTQDVILILTLLVSSLFLQWFVKRLHTKKYQKASILDGILCGIMMLFAVWLTLREQRSTGTISAYNTTVIIVIIIISLRPRWLLSIILPLHVLLLVGMFTLNSDLPQMLTDAQNVTIGILLLIIAYRWLYAWQVKGYISQQETMQANIELTRTNNSLQLLYDQMRNVNDQLYALSHYDTLTDVPNRQSLMLFFSERMLGSKQMGIMMIDIDFFKRYNDRYGHIGGDNCLITVAQALRKTIEAAGGFLGRYGGEEFVGILPEGNLESMRQLLRDTIVSVQTLNIPHEDSDAHTIVTISAGALCFYSSIDADIEQAVNCADYLLYIAKNSGRNRTLLATSVLTLPKTQDLKLYAAHPLLQPSFIEQIAMFSEPPEPPIETTQSANEAGC